MASNNYIEETQFPPLYIPINKAKKLISKSLDFSQLLLGRKYYMIGNQMLFEKEGAFYLTTIDYSENYTAADYTKLPESAPFQLIKGKLIYFPTPYLIHQTICGRLAVKVYQYVKEHKLGEALIGPLDVYLDEANIFQPDFLFVSSEREKIIKDYIYGTPDLVVEIISQTSEKIDTINKRDVYGKHNVLEYWLIHPTQKWVKVFENQKGEMVEKVTLEEKGSFESKAVEGFVLDIATLFK